MDALQTPEDQDNEAQKQNSAPIGIDGKCAGYQSKDQSKKKVKKTKQRKRKNAPIHFPQIVCSRVFPACGHGKSVAHVVHDEHNWQSNPYPENTTCGLCKKTNFYKEALKKHTRNVESRRNETF